MQKKESPANEREWPRIPEFGQADRAQLSQRARSRTTQRLCNRVSRLGWTWRTIAGCVFPFAFVRACHAVALAKAGNSRAEVLFPVFGIAKIPCATLAEFRYWRSGSW